ncbi:MAG TPA: protein TolQ [Steroidobacteraceae bacterium]|nr:protein TolQ [Steroidobacteraceae bacterium]
MNSTIIDQSFVRLIVEASLVVQIVLAVLLGASVVSWAVILRKRRALAATRAAAESFETAFWSGGDLGALYRSIEGRQGPASGMESIFEFGFREFTRLRKQGSIDASQLMEGARRAMKVAQLREIDRLESNLEMLATIGSISPYVGLFGTVWGIMHAFRGLANVQQATLQMVAPGIAEALIATAIGLFAAIPAVVAFNRFSDQVNRLELRFDTFMEEFSTILQRHATAPRGG